MYTLKVRNQYDEILELAPNEGYVITDIIGIDPPDAVINTTRNSNADGSVVNSAYADNRTITITLAINGPAEDNRINLYRYFKSKYPVQLYYQNDTRDVSIRGYVQTFNVGFFDKKQIAQITIFCPNPFFNGANDNVTEFSTIEDLFEFPFSIEEEGIEFSRLLINQETNVINGGDIDTGTVITLRAIGIVTNPTIYNTETNEFFGLNLSLAQGDVVTINTKKKEKSVKLLRGGATTSIIGKIRYGSTWFQLSPGDNLFIVTADTFPENLYTTFAVVDQFEGV